MDAVEGLEAGVLFFIYSLSVDDIFLLFIFYRIAILESVRNTEERRDLIEFTVNGRLCSWTISLAVWFSICINIFKDITRKEPPSVTDEHETWVYQEEPTLIPQFQSWPASSAPCEYPLMIHPLGRRFVAYEHNAGLKSPVPGLRLTVPVFLDYPDLNPFLNFCEN